MGLVLWIDHNTFAASLVEKVFKKRELPFYSVADAKDFSYLVDDLRPAVIVLDGDTAMEDFEAFKTQYEASEVLKATPFILMGEHEHLNKLISVNVGVLARPFDPFEVPRQLEKLLSRIQN
jgi:DNA-binding NtrC family response regulator